MDFISSYGLFIAKFVTIMAIVVSIVTILLNVISRKRQSSGQLHLRHLDKEYRQMRDDIHLAKMRPQEQKNWLKQRKKEEKLKIKLKKRDAKLGISKLEKPTLYVLEFNGSIDANEVNSLREEISAILLVAKKGDEVLLRLESPGGVVHGYGLAASQLKRLRDANLRLTIAVDKVAASGGYMMACVANYIIAAPFSIIGSIGVVAQLPNFNRLLKRKDIDIELHTAGEYKRTLTMFGENTEAGRKKFCDDLNETHQLFQEFIQKMRPSLDLKKISTGEHWYGLKALELGLVDEIGTSDALIIKQMDHFIILGVHYTRKRKMFSYLAHNISKTIDKIILKYGNIT